MSKIKITVDGGVPNLQIRIARISNGFLLKSDGTSYAATPDKVRMIFNDFLEQFIASPEYRKFVNDLADYDAQADAAGFARDPLLDKGR